MQNDLEELSKSGIAYAEKTTSELGDIEIFYSSSDYITIEIEQNSFKHCEIGKDEGFSVRAISKKGALGFSFTNKIEREALMNVVKSAIKLMKNGTEDPDFKSLPTSYKKYPKIKNILDDKIKNFKIEDAVEYAKEMIETCKQDELAISQSGDVSASFKKIYITNSNGLEIEGEKTSCSISSEIVVKDKITKDISSGFEWQSVRNLEDLTVRKITEGALENAKKNLNRKKIKTMNAPMILSPKGVINLILRPISSAVNAEAFQYKRSFMVDKRKQVIGSDLLTITDNGLLDGASGSAIFDGEGVPCQENVIIEKGTFLKTGLLHNSYTAGKEGVKSTGNAARNSYAGFPSIGITNLIMKPGNVSKKEMFENVKKGILFEYTGDSPNIATGDFSGLILQGNLIDNGEIKTPLNETMIGINLLDLFKKISLVSKEFEIYGPYRAPYVKLDNIQFIGSA